MALRIPPRRAPHLVTLPEARDHICGLEPSLDKDEVAIALLEAAGVGDLAVYDVPDFEFVLWRRAPGIDWSSGRFCVSPPHIPYTLRQYYTPLVELDQAVSLFEEKPPAPDATEPVSTAALESFVRSTMATDRLTEVMARDRADQHFAPKRVTDSRWRAAWKDEPNKLRPGEKASRKSGA